MILKQTRIRTGGAGNAVAHVLKDDDNEAVQVLTGDFEAMRDADLFADLAGHTYSLRHLVISPDEDITAEQLNDVFQLYRDEFKVGDRPFAAVRHEKTRADGSSVSHFHILMLEADSCGRILDAWSFMKRNELIARQAEVMLGHGITKGRHNKYAVETLRERGDDVIVDQLETAGISRGAPALAMFSSKALAKAGRLGVDLAAVAHAISEADPGTLGSTLAQLEKDHEIRFTKGDRRDVILLKTSRGELISNCSRAISKRCSAMSADEVIIALERARSETVSHREATVSAREQDRSVDRSVRAISRDLSSDSASACRADRADEGV